jgi:hypothetical protein
MWRLVHALVGLTLVTASARADGPHGATLADSPGMTAEPLRLDAPAPVRANLARWRYPLILTGTAMIMVPAGLWYWESVNQQKEDWELRWDLASWKSKLTSFDDVVLDTNKWTANAARHPLVGALHYQVGRANGLGPGSSLLLSIGSAVVWEYLVEYREQISLNDLVTNTAASVSIGEPLFRFGLLVDAPHASWTRRGLGMLLSPFDRTEQALGVAMRHDQAEPWARLEGTIGLSGADFGDATRLEGRAGLDLALVTEPAYGRPGTGTVDTRAFAFDTLEVDARVGDAAPEALHVPGAFVRSTTSYLGRYSRALDDDGHGRDLFVGAGTGFELTARRLGAEWDKVMVMQLFGPQIELRALGAHARISWALGASGDLGMVQAHVFGPVVPFTPEPQTSALRVRGYYYATGATLSSRLRLEVGPVRARLDATAHTFWSIDGLDRIELHGTANDPEHVADQRVRATGALGVDLGDGQRFELFGEVLYRRGTWAAQARSSTELDGGVAMTFGF